MPRYTFGCVQCEWEGDVVLKVAEYPYYERECPMCRGHLERIFQAPQVVRDTFRHDRELPGLHPFSGDEREVMHASTRTEVKSMIKEHNRRFGTDMVYE